MKIFLDKKKTGDERGEGMNRRAALRIKIGIQTSFAYISKLPLTCVKSIGVSSLHPRSPPAAFAAVGGVVARLCAESSLQTL
jgi:hypothetical protein